MVTIRPAILSLLTLVVLQAAEPAKPGSMVIIAEDFHDPAAAGRLWRGPGSADDGGWHVTLAAAGSAKCSTSLPADRLAGRKIRLSARIRSEGVSVRPNPWNGIKAMIATVTADGGKGYFQLATSDGTRPWSTVEKVLAMPADVTKADLVIGLENVSGSVWFDDVRVEVVAE